MTEFNSGIAISEGSSALVISVPHAGTRIPPVLRNRMNPLVLSSPDTDWFVDRLYDWAPETGASLIATSWSRYVIDLNRPPDDSPLYQNQSGSLLVPTTTFTGAKIYRDGLEPGDDEKQERLQLYWQPYHDHLRRLLDNALERHGVAILLDGHSIRSELPALFDGKLPNLSVGTNDGASAAESLAERVCSKLQHPDLSLVRDQRFKGGYITRHYGRPQANVHAIQLEIAQRTYMQEFPPSWNPVRASELIGLLKSLVDGLHSWRPEGKA